MGEAAEVLGPASLAYAAVNERACLNVGSVDQQLRLSSVHILCVVCSINSFFFLFSKLRFYGGYNAGPSDGTSDREVQREYIEHA